MPLSIPADTSCMLSTPSTALGCFRGVEFWQLWGLGNGAPVQVLSSSIPVGQQLQFLVPSQHSDCAMHRCFSASGQGRLGFVLGMHYAGAVPIFSGGHQLRAGPQPMHTDWATHEHVRVRKSGFMAGVFMQGLSLNIPAGTSCALVGTSGSGKSTVLRLLFRFYEPDSGTLSVAGRSITDYTMKSLRAKIGEVGPHRSAEPHTGAHRSTRDILQGPATAASMCYPSTAVVVFDVKTSRACVGASMM